MTWFRPRMRRRNPHADKIGTRRRLLFLEPLEDRLAPAIFVVNNAGDNGSGSGQAGDLRYCLAQSNATPGLDTIQFAIPGSGVQMINLTSALPAITDSVVLDGYTQSGANANTLTVGDNAVLTIQLNGAAAGSGANGVTINTGGCTIRGLVINGFGQNGILIEGASASGNIIEGNFIGTDAAGTTAVANQQAGVRIKGGANHNTIGGSPGQRNIISGNTIQGVQIRDTGSDYNWVASNYVGNDLTGELALGNGSNNVWITLGAQHNFIGTNSDGVGDANEGNVLSASLGASGVSISDEGSGLATHSPHTAFNVVAGNFIGTDATGARTVDVNGQALGNNYSGVAIYTGAAQNRIGTDGDGVSDLAERNILAGNVHHGVIIQGGGADANIVAGNYIGTDVTGMRALGNSRGVTIAALSSGAPQLNRIGANASDVDAAAEGNVIAANTTYGVYLTIGFGAPGVVPTQNIVAGNYIGTNSTATAALGNTLAGVEIESSADNTIGGASATLRNVISGNLADGVRLEGVYATGNVVAGNYIGTDAAGTVALGNATSGVTIASGAANNTIGGTDSGTRNIISGNGTDGVSIADSGTTGNVVEGNFIGTDVSGTLPLGNAVEGLLLSAGATNNTIGGATAAAGNVISGNGVFGICIRGADTSGNVVEGNLIGTEVTGRYAVKTDGLAGVRIDSEASDNTIGSTAAGAGNLISGNGVYGVGVDISGAGTSNNRVEGNFIGTDVTGSSVILYQGIGVQIHAGASNNIIGGAISGARNVIGGNFSIGIQITDAGSRENLVQGNYVGLAADNSTTTGNSAYGITVFADGNTIGGTTPEARNVISNNQYGVYLVGNNNVFQGNYVGTDATGTVSRGNEVWGVNVTGANIIGGPTTTPGTGPGNVISGNGGTGLVLIAAIDSAVQGNIIGLDASGTNALGNNALGNGSAGIEVLSLATGLVIGGTAPGDDNLISANAGDGVGIDFRKGQYDQPTGAMIEGNYIGTDITGTLDRGNAGAGVGLYGAAEITIGGASVAVRNLISGNDGPGVRIETSDATGNVVAGNFIGTDVTGTVALANALDGVLLQAGANNNTIGGSVYGVTGNVISGNGQAGVVIREATSTGNLVLGNSIGVTAGNTAKLGNASYGIWIDGAENNRIGGPPIAEANIIGGNAGGVLLSNASHNDIFGDLIGTDVDIALDLGNSLFGIHIIGTSVGNRIGDGLDPNNGNFIVASDGPGVWLDGAGVTETQVLDNTIGKENTSFTAPANSGDGVLITDSPRTMIGGQDFFQPNVISGNGGNGIAITGSAATGNLVQGNLIGVDFTGTHALGNAASGVDVSSGASDNTIGGITAAARNIISGNLGGGVDVLDAGTTSNVIAGNYIGVAADGLTTLPNQGPGASGQFGVLICNASGNTVGGTTAGAGNVIAGEAFAQVEVSNAADTLIAGNFIGTDSTGTVAENGGIGVYLAKGTTNATVGGTTAAARNVISGNTGYGGVFVDNASDCVIEGNYIGTNAAGADVLANNFGVWVSLSSNITIGGTAAGAGNVISGNASFGIQLSAGGTTTTGYVVQGNYIGTNAAGTVALPNQGDGVWLNGAFGDTIGGTTAGAGNLISGNVGSGVDISGSGAIGNVVEGNSIGTDVTGPMALGNADEGIRIENGASNNTIGGTTAEARNIISGNIGPGVSITGSDTSGNVVEGNYVGITAGGDVALSNGLDGVLISGYAHDNTIGGTAAGAGNVLSGNTRSGIDLQGGYTNLIQGNLIGTNPAGTALITNYISYGILINSGSSGNTIGGITAAARNVIAGRGVGIQIDDAGGAANNNVVEGNYIGTDISGTTILGGGIGVLLAAAAPTQGVHGNVIGGTVAGAGNVISGNSEDGVRIAGSSATDNSVEGNYIGTNAAGTAALGNGIGVAIDSGAVNNTIGGAATGAGNVISGNVGAGVNISGSGTMGNMIEGNYIGTDVTGVAALPNNGIGTGGSGVEIDGAANNTVGGTVAGAGNVIAGSGTGVSLVNGAAGNLVAGNYIGTNASGTAALPNFDGVFVYGPGNIIGGTTPAARNIISGNLRAGLIVAGSDNVVQGNYIGTDPSGLVLLADQNFGVLAGPTDNLVIGGTAAGAGNVIAAPIGIELDSSTATLIQGNYIGTDATGTKVLLGGRGILIENASVNTTIGGTTAQARNVISGHGYYAIEANSDSTGTLIQGNYIGTDVTGTIALGNGGGILVRTANNTIGGTVAGTGNLISGNAGDGVIISDSGTTGNLVEGNYIGTDVTGSVALGNLNGVVVQQGASGTIIGGTTAAARNVISGNGPPVLGGGIVLDSPGNLVEGNYIGTNAAGTAAVANGDGIAGGHDNTIGGLGAGAGNLISGNIRFGVSLNSNDVLQGNLIGTDATGTGAIPNGGGVTTLDHNTIGGAAASARNIISGNYGHGIWSYGFGAGTNLIQGNYIGLDVSGTVALGNGGDGIVLQTSNGNTIGGTAAGAGNVLSGNGGEAGILIVSGATGNVVAGNFIGTDATGTVAVPNLGDGVLIRNGASSNTIGGTTTASGNVISSNLGDGVQISGSGTTGNAIQGNSIGITADPTALGNQGDGVRVDIGASHTLIGGITAGAGNTIAFNGAAGVAIIGSATTGNSILGNAIYGNSQLGIDLGGAGSRLPNDIQGHSGPNNFENYPVLTLAADSDTSRTVSVSLFSTPNTTFRIEFFADSGADPSGVDQGEVYLGFVEATTDAGGHAVFDYTYAADPAHPYLTSTATDPFGNTSEFSGRDLPPVVVPAPPPPESVPLPIPESSTPAAPSPAIVEAPVAIEAVAEAAVEPTVMESISSSSSGKGAAPGGEPQAPAAPFGDLLVSRGETGLSFDGSDRAGIQSITPLPSVSAAVDALGPPQILQGPKGPGGERTPPSPETQLLDQTTKATTAILYADDSVSQFEDFLRGKTESPPEVGALAEFDKPPSEVQPTAAVETPEETIDTPAALPGLLKRLAVPAVMTLAATGWLWYRVRRGRIGKPTSTAKPGGHGANSQ